MIKTDNTEPNVSTTEETSTLKTDHQDPNIQTTDHQEEIKADETTTSNVDTVKIAVIGNVDSGKSTLVGVLTKGIVDDGRGSARLRVFNYAHEANNGRTSSIGHEIMGFDKEGKQMFADRFVQNKNKYWGEVVKKSQKVITLLDLCGHEKYLKTTMFGLVGMVPDYSMIIVGANMGISRMTKEHLGITLALKIPFFVVVTKIDMCPENVFKETMETLLNILKSGGVNRKPIMIKNDDEIKACSAGLSTDKICPIFPVSSVSGEGIDKLTTFMSLLHARNTDGKVIKGIHDPIQFDINENFSVSGVGTVVSGIVKAGTITVNTTLLLGPDKANTFKPVSVKSIHVNRVAADVAYAGQFACLAIRPVNKKEVLNRDEFRKGMILIDANLKPDPHWEFDAEVVILHHATTIETGYQAVAHCGVIRQAVSVEELPKDILRTGDKGLVKFKFMYHPEYVQEGQTVILREGRTKIIGKIVKVHDAGDRKKGEEKKEEKKEDKKEIKPVKKEEKINIQK